MKLTHTNRIFNKNGYVLIRGFFNKDEANNIVKYANEIQNLPEVKNKWLTYYEKNNNVRKKSRVENFTNYHEGINNLLYQKIIPSINKELGENYTLFKDKINWKLPNGKGFKAHQDYPAWSDFPPKFYITVALFGNNSTKENGCLQFSNFDSKTLLPENFDENKLEWNHEEATPNDLLIFNSYVPHRSSENNSDKSRRIFYFTFNRELEGNYYQEYFNKKKIEFPQDLDRDENSKINYNTKYNYANPFS